MTKEGAEKALRCGISGKKQCEGVTECGGYALLWVALFFAPEYLKFPLLLLLPEVVAVADAGHSWLRLF